MDSKSRHHSLNKHIKMYAKVALVLVLAMVAVSQATPQVRESCIILMSLRSTLKSGRVVLS